MLIPPKSVEAEEPNPIGYKIYGDVVEIWNLDTTYYFNKSSGIQWTEDPEQYWTRNIFSIGYYSNGEWHKIYSADELGTFNRDIESDYLTYVNATLWKDFTYAGYDLRLGIRYHLKVDDEDLSIIIYSKNLDTEDYPVELGFAWMVTDIDIPNPLGKDTIFINETDYRLDGVYDLTFKNMSHPHYRIFDYTQFLTLEWDADVDYTVRLQCNGIQEEASVTWMVNGGIFQSGQEKSTTLYWADAEGDYTGISWDILGGGAARGITTDGTNIWTVDSYDAEVRKYDIDGNYISKWDTNALNSGPYGITTDGSNIYISDNDHNVYKYAMAGSYVSSFSIAGQSGDPEGITTDGTNIWVADSGDLEVYKYTMAGSYVSSFDTSWLTYPWGVITDGTNIWIVDYNNAQVYKCNMAGTYVGPNWDTATSGNAAPWGGTTDGTDFFWISDTSDDKAYKYVYVTPPPTPKVSSAQIKNMDNTDDLFPIYRWYEFEAVADDEVSEISKVYLRGKDGANTIFEVRGDSLNSTPAWTIQTGANIIDLDTSSCSWETSGTEGTATFSIRIEYDHPQYLNMEIDVYAENTEAGNSGWVNKQTDYFDIITNLVTTFNLDDDRGNLSQSVTASGHITFEGSSLYPSDSNFTSVSVYDSSNNNEGSDSSIVNGAWSVTFNAPSSLGIDTYNLYINIIGDYPDGEETSPTDTFITDRFIVTSIWVSKETLIVGQTVYIYVTGYLEYDSHESHYDDSLVIEDLTFYYDWENTRWYATDSRETEGENVYNTLTSCEEVTYDITVGTMDGKSESATWLSSQYDFYGPYYENGSNADPMNITLIVNGISETIELDGNYTKYTAGTASLVIWALPEGGTRYYQINSNNETIYIFIPEATYSTYTFTIYCYSAGVPGYLESNRYVNGTRRMVERKEITPSQNQVPMIMIVGEAYFMNYDAKDECQYDLGIFVPGTTNPTYTITKSGITSAEKSVYRWIKVTKSRSTDNTQIDVNYKDELDNTTWLDLEILFLNGTIAYETNITNPNPAVQFQWNNADNETEYLGVLEIKHDQLGDYTHRMTFPLYTAFSRPFNLGFLGSIGLYGFFISDLISIGAIIGVATVFSTKDAVLGAFTITILTFALIAMGWVNWGYGLPTLAFLVVILMGINEARKGG